MKFKYPFPYRKRHVIYFVTLFILFFEISTYWFATISWKSINCGSKIKCTKILLVANPQLTSNEHSIISQVAIWDSDRYLSRTFWHAFKFALPDLVIFLGDLFDEGSKSTDEEFESYVHRLHSIFENPGGSGVKHIYVPGDKDIADEGVDLISKSSVERFEKFFKQSAIFSTKKLKVHNVNRFLHTNVHRIEGEKGPVVGISHLPLISMNDNYTDQILEQLEPHVLFSAHYRDVVIYKENYDVKPHQVDIPIVVLAYDNKIYVRKIKIGQVHEFVVPTCSDPKRIAKMMDQNGYGLAVIDEEEVRFTVLWTPSRYSQFRVYGLILGWTGLCWFLIILSRKPIKPKSNILLQDESYP